MTLGQRIQELRRQYNLSQEALGDRLGVSRQAISKWESDITIPEVDKLIAMSKQFGVSVGVLLGVEEPAREQEPAAQEPAAQELTDRELAAVETIVSRYIEQMEAVRPQPEVRVHRLSTGWKRALAAAAILVVVAAVKTVSDLNARIDDLNRQTGNVRNQMINVENNVTSQLYQMSTRLEKLLEEQGSLLLEQRCTLTDYMPGQYGEFTLIARPKEYVPGMSAVFYAKNEDGETVSQTAQLENGQFRARLRTPPWALPTFSVELDDGQSRKLQPIQPDEAYDLTRWGLEPRSSGSMGNWYLSKNNRLELELQLHAELAAYTPGNVNAHLLEPQELEFVVTYRDQVLLRRTLGPENWNPDTHECSVRVTLSDTYQVEGEGRLEGRILGRDNFGREINLVVYARGVAYGQNESKYFPPEAEVSYTDWDSLVRASGDNS